MAPATTFQQLALNDEFLFVLQSSSETQIYGVFDDPSPSPSPSPSQSQQQINVVSSLMRIRR